VLAVYRQVGADLGGSPGGGLSPASLKAASSRKVVAAADQ
jgi:hypothetical protein